MDLRMYKMSGGRLPVFLHVAAWAVLLFLPLYLQGYSMSQDLNFLYRIYSHVVVYMLLFYVNFFWLIPAFFFKRKKVHYVLLNLALIMVLFFVIGALQKYVIPKNELFEEALRKAMRENHIEPPSMKIHVFNYMATSVLVCGFSLGLRFFNKYIESEKVMKELEKEHLNSELAFLKNQINPHFFFNTLNNIYSLIQINTADAQHAVLKLSKLMRYILYESEQGDTLLSREIDFMKNYIDLMRLRLSSKVDLTVSFPEKYDDVSVSPLLFVSFIENAFKHGVSYRDKSFIHIVLETSDGRLIFSCRNSVSSVYESAEKGSGIGLENVKKRLALLYPGNHTLAIVNSGDEFSVSLVVNNLKKSNV